MQQSLVFLDHFWGVLWWGLVSANNGKSPESASFTSIQLATESFSRTSLTILTVCSQFSYYPVIFLSKPIIVPYKWKALSY